MLDRFFIIWIYGDVDVDYDVDDHSLSFDLSYSYKKSFCPCFSYLLSIADCCLKMIFYLMGY